jgi:hypothetical protein
MSPRRLYLDRGVGQTRGVVTLDGRPEQLILLRDGDDANLALGAQSVARVRKVERAFASAFIELAGGVQALLPFRPEVERIVDVFAHIARPGEHPARLGDERVEVARCQSQR